MFNKKELTCQIANATVRVWCQEMPAVRGKKETRLLRCEHSAQCPRTAFCRFVNPLTTRLPFDAAQIASAPSLPAVPTPPAAARPATASRRLTPVADRPASS